MPPSDDEPRDEDGTSASADPDRAAILARRQRFIALALTGLASTGCEKPTKKPGGEVHQGQDDAGKACLKVAAPILDVGTPQPCLEVAEPPAPEPGGEDDATPQPCLMVIPDPPPKDDGGNDDDAAPRPCLNIAPPPDPEPGGDDDATPRPCLRVAQPPPDPKPQPCLRVAPPPEPEPAPPRPCLKIAKPRPDK
ncbi:MAG: hypothetical protein AAF799_06530 [Myxococcota bacterium]